MNYLDTTEYLTYGLDAATDPSWVTAASAIIDAHCRRATLGVNQYEERLKMPPELNTVRLELLATRDRGSGYNADRFVARSLWDSATRRMAVSRDESGVRFGIRASGIVDDD